MTEKRETYNAAGEPVQVAASEVKNSWHEYLDRVCQAREAIVVTRYGKPIARLVPIESEPETGSGVFGCLSGTVSVHGDIEAPTGEVWNADA